MQVEWQRIVSGTDVSDTIRVTARTLGDIRLR